MKTAREYRQMARGQLGGGIFSNLWLNGLLACLLVSVVLGFLSPTAIGTILLEGFLLSGLATVFVKLARGGNSVDFGDLLSAKSNVSTILLLSLLKNIFVLLWSLLFFIPGIVKSYSYSMAYYIFSDHPDYDWKKCIDESRRMMNGKKWKLFCLDLSFIGWYIVGALCLGIGVLWVAPYHALARANFYEDLTKLDA